MLDKEGKAFIDHSILIVTISVWRNGSATAS